MQGPCSDSYISTHILTVDKKQLASGQRWWLHICLLEEGFFQSLLTDRGNDLSRWVMVWRHLGGRQEERLEEIKIGEDGVGLDMGEGKVSGVSKPLEILKSLHCKKKTNNS